MVEHRFLSRKNYGFILLGYKRRHILLSPNRTQNHKRQFVMQETTRNKRQTPAFCLFLTEHAATTCGPFSPIGSVVKNSPTLTFICLYH